MTDWRAEKAAQNDHLRMQLAALDSGPKSRWMRFRLLAVHCGRCGEILLEVMDTSPYPVVRYRGVVNHPGVDVLPADAAIETRIAHQRAKPGRIRRDDAWRFDPIPANIPPDDPSLDHNLVTCACRCRNLSLSERMVFADLRSGRGKRVIPPPSDAQE